MYRYTDFDRGFIHARAAQFRDQLERHLAGTLAEDDFRPLGLQNGWYEQRQPKSSTWRAGNSPPWGGGCSRQDGQPTPPRWWCPVQAVPTSSSRTMCSRPWPKQPCCTVGGPRW